MNKFFLFLFILFSSLCGTTHTYAGKAKPLLDKGWKELVKDNDIEALQYFGKAYEVAKQENSTEDIAASLLNMGMCTYSISYSKGLEYALLAINEYKKLEPLEPQKALEGRSRCLQLISTIYARQGKYKESINLSKQAIAGFPINNDSTGSLGLIFVSLGNAFSKLGIQDSSEFYHRKALTEWTLSNNFVYLPSAYINVAEIERKNGNNTRSKMYLDRSLMIADSTGNRQAQVSALLSLGKWFITVERNNVEAELCYMNALKVAAELRDKSFYLKTIEQLISLKKSQGKYKEALIYEEEIVGIRDTLYSWDKERMAKKLEIQFQVAEKDRQMQILQQEKNITSLTNYLLWVTIGFIVLISVGIIFVMRRNIKRDKLLIQTKEALVLSIQEQKKWREQQMQHELEFRESQLSALALQMLQKNNLIQDLKNTFEENGQLSNEKNLHKILNQGLNHDKEWNDFNTYFESINKSFFSRLKQSYPEISPNDLKICALIKLNLSIKDMAGILNISPDSVKTARYRLRKKLQLNTEDNLTDFIMNLE